MAGTSFGSWGGILFGGRLVLLLFWRVSNALRTTLMLTADTYPVVAVGRLAVVTCVLDPHSNLLLYALARCFGLWFRRLPLLIIELEIVLLEDRSSLL